MLFGADLPDGRAYACRVTPSDRLVPAVDVAFEIRDGTVYVAQLPDGPIVVLRDTAALIWEEAQRDDLNDLAFRVASRVAGPVDDLDEQVSAFVSRLVEGGLLAGVS
jgi:hypothetical protein